jgi:hypothetical protein
MKTTAAILELPVLYKMFTGFGRVCLIDNEGFRVCMGYREAYILPSLPLSHNAAANTVPLQFSGLIQTPRTYWYVGKRKFCKSILQQKRQL